MADTYSIKTENEMAEKAEKVSNIHFQSSLIAKSNNHRASTRDKKKKMKKAQKKREESKQS